MFKNISASSTRSREKKNILISAPTGSGKTLTSFLSILNNLIGLAEIGKLEDKIYAVYSSPLKALSNDIHKNLVEPLEEINELAKSKGVELGGNTFSPPTLAVRVDLARQQRRLTVNILIVSKFRESTMYLRMLVVYFFILQQAFKMIKQSAGNFANWLTF